MNEIGLEKVRWPVCEARLKLHEFDSRMVPRWSPKPGRRSERA